jgi:hypothetical protein
MPVRPALARGVLPVRGATDSRADLPPNISSNGRDLDRGFIRADEREALLAYLRKL